MFLSRSPPDRRQRVLPAACGRRRRLQVESTLGRIPGYGYGEPARTNDPRAWLRRIGRIAPGGRGQGAEALRLKLAAAGWSRLLTPEELAGLKVVLPLACTAWC